MCQCLMSSLKTTLIIFENTAGLFFISFQEVIFLPYLPHLEKYERIPVDYRNVSNNLNQTKRRVKKKKNNLLHASYISNVNFGDQLLCT